MSVTTDLTAKATNQCRAEIRDRTHRDCFACGPANSTGLKLDFNVLEDGSVEGEFGCPDIFTGYPGRLQGGIAASLLDSAMTNCLFARGVTAVTAELNCRYRHPVYTGTSVRICAQVERESQGLYLLTGGIYQRGLLCVTSQGKFFVQPRLNNPTQE